MKNLTLCLLILLLPLISISQNRIVKCGYTAMTCYGAGNSGYVLAVHDVRALTNTIPDGTNSSPPVTHLSDWTAGRMGQVFGIAIDNDGNIYVTASTSYGNNNSPGSAGHGGIYKVDGITGAVSDFASLPNTGSGLGNICHHPDLDLFYVTNFEDGKIYRLDMSGTILGTFDHNGPSSQTNPPFIDLGERPWGIAYYDGRIYYGIWTENKTVTNPTQANEVWSVAIDGTGNFVNSSSQCEVILPVIKDDWSSPPSDISFSDVGNMLVAERTMKGDMQDGAHSSRILEYSGIAPLNSCNPNWGTAKVFYIGAISSNTNAAGGVDYGYGGYDVAGDELLECDSIIWGTGDGLIFQSNPTIFSYGLAGLRAAGNSNVPTDPYFTETSSYHIDADGILSSQDKTDIGDTELYFCGCDDGGSGGGCVKEVDTKTFSTIIETPRPDNRNMDLGYSGIQDSDSGDYLICGETNSFSSQDIYVNTLDISGTISTSAICGWNQQSEMAHWMNESLVNPNLPNGGYVYTGSVNQEPNRDMHIKVTDKSGSIINTTIFGGNDNSDEIGYSVIEDRNGDYVAVGKRISQNGGISAFAAGLDSSFSVKWIKEYRINGFAWSVVEMPRRGADGQNVYAVTGVSNNRVFIMVISAATGNPIGAPQLMTYDLDSNPATQEVGHSINVDQTGNLILTGAAESGAVLDSVINSANNNTIFIMRIPNANVWPSPTSPGVYDYVYLLDIPDSDNELGRHIIANAENEYLITGRAYARDQKQLIDEGHGYLLKVRNSGYQVEWINEYLDPNYAFTNLERVEQAQDGGYYLSGSIWNVGPNARDYNKFALKTDTQGKLSDCDCCAPIQVNSKSPIVDQRFYDVSHISFEDAYQAQFEQQLIHSDQTFCDQYCPQQGCDIVTTHTIDIASDTCCIVKLDLNNGMSGVYGIQIDIIGGGVVFDFATVNLAMPFFIDSNGPSYIKLNSTAGEIPPGFYNDFIKFCYGISSGSSNSQTIMITYYDEFCNLIRDCRDIIETDCEVVPTDEECFEIEDIVIECDSTLTGLYKVTFNVDNNSGQVLGDLTFFPVGTGITVIPSTVSITPPVLTGTISDDQCMSVYTTGPFPKTIQLTYSMIDTAGLFCCSVNDTLNLTLPNCCDPCENNDVFAVLNQTTTDIDSCCHTVDIHNSCDQILTKIQAEVLTPGVSFSSTYIGGGWNSSWTLNPITGTLVDYVPDILPAPAGLYNELVGFCLQNSVNAFPQEVAIHYYISDGMGGEDILCTDIILLECETEEEECIEVVEYEVYCDSLTGEYFLDFCIENISVPPFTATEIALYVPAPYDFDFAVSPNLFSGLTFGFGDVFCGTTQITGIPPNLPMAGDILTIEFEMHYNLPNQPYECCEIRDSINIVLPECDTIPDNCIDITEYDVYCDPATGEYFVDFCIQNVSSPPFTATEIALYVPTPYDADFAVSPNLFNGLNFLPGDVFCGTTQIAGIPPNLPMAGDVLTIEFEMHYNLPNEPYECCTIRDSINIELPPCGCEQPQDPHCCDLLDVESIPQSRDKCCYTNVLTNNKGTGVIQLIATILTPNRVFGSVTPIGGFNTSVSGGATIISATHSGGFIPLGTNPAYDFCIINTTLPSPTWTYSTQIEYQWVEIVGNQEVVICREIINYKCARDIIIDPTVCVGDISVNPEPQDLSCYDGVGVDPIIIELVIPVDASISEVAIEVVDNKILGYNICNNDEFVTEIIRDECQIYLDVSDFGVQQGIGEIVLYLEVERTNQLVFELIVNQISMRDDSPVTCEITKTITGCDRNGELNDVIDSGLYQYQDNIQIDGHIQQGSNVTLKAGNQVSLIEGFTVDLNAVFDVQIDKCLIIVGDQ